MRINFPFFIAKRYLISKKSHHAINIISAISVCGVAFATMALVCTLSVFNGFQDLVASFFTAFDPQLKVVPVKGKTINTNAPEIQKLHLYPAIAVFTESYEDQALAVYGNRQVMVTVKGVEDNFTEQTDIESLLYGNGSFVLHADVLQYGIPGIRLATDLGLGTSFEEPLKLFAPQKGSRINMANPAASFNQDELYSPGVVFAVNQEKYDKQYLITSIDFARKLFDQNGKMTSLDLRLKKEVDPSQAKKDIEALLGPEFKVLDRYEQQADIFRIMKVEKLIAYIFLTFILLVACFNIIGSVSMLIIDKKKDIVTLRNLGATDQQIVRIFLFEGRLIATWGAVAGIILGLILCLLQQHYGFLKMGGSSGSFLVEAYPVSIYLKDILLIFLTVIIVGYGALWYPVRHLSRKLLD